MTSLPDDSSDNKQNDEAVSGTFAKEREFGSRETPNFSENVPIVEVGRIPETQAEKDGHIERTDREYHELKNPVHDDNGQVLVTSPAAHSPKIVLPISEGTFLNKENWKLPVSSAIRWLLTWAKRIGDKNPGETGFKN